MIYEFACGHFGRTNTSPYAKAPAFIRVAEVRGALVVPNPKPCPECGR